MYTVSINIDKLNGSSVNGVISDGKAENNNLKIFGGAITKSINTIDSFVFSIYPNNPYYEFMIPLITEISVFDNLHNEKQFTGRILNVTDSMDEQGHICKSIICEGLLGYLCDTVQPYMELHNISVRSFLGLMITNHNNQSSRKFKVGAVTVTDNNDSLYRYLNWESTLDCIKTKLLDKLGGEIQIREDTDGTIILDYLERIGSSTDTKIELAVNLKSISKATDSTAMITRLYPLGAKAEDSEQRLTIASANKGINYIEDDDLVSKNGVISGTQTWDDVTVATNLLAKGKAYLETLNKIKKQYTITALDLSTINKNFEEFQLGNTHKVVNPLMKIDEEIRIIGLTINMDEPYKSALTLGDKFETLTSLTSNKNKSMQSEITDTQFRNMSVMNEKIENATALITGAKGGHVILDPSEKPERILVMDTNSVDTASSCIILNKAGLGFWRKSYGGSPLKGPYRNAWTIDGNLVASFITALTLTGLKINNGSGTFAVSEDGHVTMKSATITNGILNNGSGTFRVDQNGNVTANSLNSTNANITGGIIKIKSKSGADYSLIDLYDDTTGIKIAPGFFSVKSSNGTETRITSGEIVVSHADGSNFGVRKNSISYPNATMNISQIYAKKINADDIVLPKILASGATGYVSLVDYLGFNK